MKKLYFFSLIISSIFLSAQPFFPENGEVFRDDLVPRIDILAAEDDLTFMFENVESNEEHPATFIFNSGTVQDTIENVGFRLRGNTSRLAAKKSFKVSFNTFVAGRKYKGLEKMNLNGEHNDPSIARSKLGWDIYRQMGIVSPRINHVKLYLNGSYMGLYANVEHIDEEFIESRFGNNNGNLYKCLYGGDLAFLGFGQDNYKQEMWGRRTYQLKTNTAEDDYSDFAQFVSTIHFPGSDFATAIQEIFNVDAFLKTLAVDMFIGNWDGYSYNINNYYLYHNLETDKFEYLPYDIDNTFGIDFLGKDWGTRHIYNWTPGPTYPPLTTKILGVIAFRDRFSYYLNHLMENYVHPDTIFPKIDALHDLITPAAEADFFRTFDYGYSITDFHDSFDTALNEYAAYGIKPYIQTRYDKCLVQLYLQNIAPIVSNLAHLPHFPQDGQTITIQVAIENDDTAPISVNVFYHIDGGTESSLSLYDDGTNGDLIAGDGIYSSTLGTFSEGETISYYVTATDSEGLSNRLPVSGDNAFTVLTPSPNLRINEYMASNDGTVADEFGEYDDWIEIYNADDTPISLGNKYVSDNFNNPDKWQLPNVTLPSGGFLLIWADDQADQGDQHASFKLNKDSDQIGIFDADYTGFAPIDTLSFANAASDISYGLLPDGTGEMVTLASVSPGLTNLPVGLGEPSESGDNFFKIRTLQFDPHSRMLLMEVQSVEAIFLNLSLVNIAGQTIGNVEPIPLNAGTHFYSQPIHCKLPKGIFFLKISWQTADGKSGYLPTYRLLNIR